MPIDLNCDVGEQIAGRKNYDAVIMPFITSCNIACGFHSGNPYIIQQTIQAALAHNVLIGAHPSYNDPENFGRKSIQVKPDVLAAQLRYQISAVKGMVESVGGSLNHVKAHGALYNDMVKDRALAGLFVETVAQIDPNLKIYGMANSLVVDVCKEQKMTFVHEVFADRKYDGPTQLRSRKKPDGVIHKTEDVLAQVALFLNGKVKDIKTETHPIKAETICLHSDTKDAVLLAKKISVFLKNKQRFMKI